MDMDTSLLVTSIFAVVISLGIIGAFWGRTRRRKLALREELMGSRDELERLPRLLVSAKYPELDGIEDLVKKEKVNSLEKIVGDLGSRLLEDQKHFTAIQRRKAELKKLVTKLGSMKEPTEDLEKVLELMSKEGV